MKTIMISALLLTSLASPCFAIKTIAVKNNRALLDLEGEEIVVGDRIGARDAEGKPKAILEIKQVKNGKAVAAVVKGQMQAEYKLKKMAGGNKSAATSTAASPGKSGWGFTAGYSMNNMTVKPTGASSISLSGSSFNLSGFYQIHIDGGFSARILGGYETLQATGTSAAASCTGSADCKIDISYLGMEALVRYSYIQNNTVNAWLGGGLGFLFAMSKSSNVVDTSKISTNQTIVAALGLDYHLSSNSFIPVQLDYALYPDNNTSTANQIILRAGYGFSF